ncbi:MAG: hypothetical protein Q9220_004918 [cf. Caloplaca sp. 1 TL-2023]
MPRIKAMTTGSIPSFLDVILNFAEGDESSGLEGQDTWLAQLGAKRNGQLILYGDDTWLKLFPKTFAHSDDDQDFTQVDVNVTRNVPGALSSHQWSGMILHYLGLDHIGHKMGPKSLYMVPKQMEMDKIVREIYEALDSKEHLHSTLLILCGDHGMNDAGNHGGSTEGETSPALVFISPKLQPVSQHLDCPASPSDGSFGYYRKVEQSDLVPTLAGLMGFPIPRNNLGVFIPNFLPLWSEDDRIQMLQQNAQQILKVIKETFPSVAFDGRTASSTCADAGSEGMLLACQWTQVEDSKKVDGPAEYQTAQDNLYMIPSCRKGNGPRSTIHAATPLVIMRVIRAWNQTGQKYASQFDVAHKVLPARPFTLWFLVIGTYVALPLRMRWKHRSRVVQWGSFIAAVMLCAMAFVFKVSFTLADSPDLLEGSYVVQINALRTIGLVKQAQATFAGMAVYCGGVLLFSRKLSPRPLSTEARLSADDDDLTAKMVPLQGILTLFLVTQTRLTNIPLFALCELQMQLLGLMNLSSAEMSVTSIILQYASFFAFGGSNAISSIDLSSAYNGVSGYNVGVVGALTFCSNWAGPIWWLWATIRLPSSTEQRRGGQYNHFALLSTSFVANTNLAVMLACTALRTHLFIWTVFSPKYLYVIAWSLGQHMCVSTLLFQTIRGLSSGRRSQYN